MVPTLPPSTTSFSPRIPWRSTLLIGALVGLATLLWPYFSPRPVPPLPSSAGKIAPLAMSGGNPRLRALMRMISASEANDPRPYTLLYGGTHVQDLSQHPDRCIRIVAGPNQGDCTTAAGRYQFINTTWAEKAALYHPQPSGLWMWRRYSFEPKYQDRVLYAWLQDSREWGMNIPAQLQAGKLQSVLKRLSGTWTSLGYGIEDNVVTPHLAQIYQQLLAEELANAAS